MIFAPTGEVFFELFHPDRGLKIDIFVAGFHASIQGSCQGSLDRMEFQGWKRAAMNSLHEQREKLWPDWQFHFDLPKLWQNKKGRHVALDSSGTGRHP